MGGGSSRNARILRIWRCRGQERVRNVRNVRILTVWERLAGLVELAEKYRVDVERDAWSGGASRKMTSGCRAGSQV